jgi:glycine amidinotransferase
MVGRDLFIDLWDVRNAISHNSGTTSLQSVQRHVDQWARKWLPEVKVHWIEVGGHNDACFHTCKPGVILSIVDVIDYNQSFPGWNVLVIPPEESADNIDEKTCVVSNHNKMVFDYFKKHNIEPIIAPLRHRYFWDGGIHCCTLDLYRQGECQQYINWS